MCRNIRRLFNYEPEVTQEEIRASALQYVRKVSGYTHPSKVNEDAFAKAVERVTAATEELLGSLATSAPKRNRAVDAEKARERGRRVGHA